MIIGRIEQDLISQFSEQGNVQTVLKSVVFIFLKKGELNYKTKFM